MLSVSEEQANKIVAGLCFRDGLVQAIVQDAATSEVLMNGFMSEEAVRKTLVTSRLWLWSRTRNRLWMKGESSGNIQLVKEVYVDCDSDSLLIKVEAKPICHEGYETCFHKKLVNGKLEVVEEKVFDPTKIYGE